MKRTVGIPPPTVFFVPIFKKKEVKNYEIQNNYINWSCRLPAVFGKSPKSENGALESRAGWKGLCRKGMTLLYVLIAARLDALMGTEYLRDAVCIGFIANEGLSIIENAGLMGLPLPESICQAIDVLKRHSQNTIEKQT